MLGPDSKSSFWLEWAQLGFGECRMDEASWLWSPRPCGPINKPIVSVSEPLPSPHHQQLLFLWLGYAVDWERGRAGRGEVRGAGACKTLGLNTTVVPPACLERPGTEPTVGQKDPTPRHAGSCSACEEEVGRGRRGPFPMDTCLSVGLLCLGASCQEEGRKFLSVLFP